MVVAMPSSLKHVRVATTSPPQAGSPPPAASGTDTAQVVSGLLPDLVQLLDTTVPSSKVALQAKLAHAQAAEALGAQVLQGEDAATLVGTLWRSAATMSEADGDDRKNVTEAMVLGLDGSMSSLLSDPAFEEAGRRNSVQLAMGVTDRLANQVSACRHTSTCCLLP